MAGVAGESEALLAERIEREFVEGLVGGREPFDRYRSEVEASGLLEHLQAGYEEFLGDRRQIERLQHRAPRRRRGHPPLLAHP